MAVPLLCGVGKCCCFLANCLLDVQGRGYPQEDVIIVPPRSSVKAPWSSEA